MNIANVTSRFAALAGLDNGELYKWRALIDDAREYVELHSLVENPDKAQTRRLEMLCAAYAFWLFEMCNEEGVTSFTAGDVQITSPGGGKSRGERLWNELCVQNGDLIGTGGFLFGSVKL